MGAVNAKDLEQNSRLERDMKQPAGPEYQHDPLEGFANGRKRREIKATEAEMESAKIPMENRDYCVDYLLKFLSCRADHPILFANKCTHEKHEYLHCQYEDYVIRMKELEREKRLAARDAKIAAQELAEH